MVRKGSLDRSHPGIVAACGFGVNAARRRADIARSTAPPPRTSACPRRKTSRLASRVQGQVGRPLLLSQGHDPGCTIEAHNFQRDLPKYDALNAVVLGVSLDTVESHKTFCTKDSLTFKLLADPDHKVIDAYGVPVSAHGDNEVRQPRHVPHLARRQDREGVDQRQPEHPQRRRPRRASQPTRNNPIPADAKRPGLSRGVRAFLLAC